MMHKLTSIIFLTLFCSLNTGADAGVANEIKLAAAAPEVFGYIEEVMLEPGRQWKLKAKLDTGADISSLDARDVLRVKAGGKSYVRFTVTDPVTQEGVSLRRPYVRSTRIRRHDGKHQRRRVVLMTVCLGRHERTIEVTLSDRSEFDFSMLLGRNALAGVAIVDPRLELTHEPGCWITDSQAGNSGAKNKRLSVTGQQKVHVNKMELSADDQNEIDEQKANWPNKERPGHTKSKKRHEKPGLESATQ